MGGRAPIRRSAGQEEWQWRRLTARDRPRRRHGSLATCTKRSCTGCRPSWSRCRSGCASKAPASWSSSRAATRPARAARSSGSPSTSTPASPASWRCPRRPNGNGRSGTSSVTPATCLPPANWPCSTGAGTTAQASSTSWAFAPRGSTAASCTSAPSSSGCWSRRAFCSANTGSRSATMSSSAGSSHGWTIRCAGGSCPRWILSPSPGGRTIRVPRTRCSCTPTSRRRRGMSWKATTNGGPGSI